VSRVIKKTWQLLVLNSFVSGPIVALGSIVDCVKLTTEGYPVISSRRFIIENEIQGELIKPMKLYKWILEMQGDEGNLEAGYVLPSRSIQSDCQQFILQRKYQQPTSFQLRTHTLSVSPSNPPVKPWKTRLYYRSERIFSIYPAIGRCIVTQSRCGTCRCRYYFSCYFPS